jgi:hypothetical protein
MAVRSAWAVKFERYLNDAFSVHESDLQVRQWVNKFTKWWLEQVRNILAVSAFYFLAKKTGNGLLELLSSITVLLLLNYFSNWQNTYSFRFLPYIKNPRANFWVNGALWLCVTLCVWLIVIALIAEVMRALGKLVPQ